MARQWRSVLITGATGGVGRAAVTRLDQDGWRVFAGVRSAAAGERLVQGTSHVTPVRLDICDEASITAAQAEIAAALDGAGLDALVNNAGLSVDGPLELVPIPRLRRQLEVNVIGQVAVTQAFLPLLLRGGGRIVNIGGAAGRMALPMLGALSASKAALDSVSDALRMELKHQGVAVSHIEPGALATDLFTKSAQTVAQDGFTGTEHDQARYAQALANLAEAASRQKQTPVDRAAAAIATALTARRPKARYLVGREPRVLLPLLRAFPVALRDRAIMSSLGLTKKAFTAPAARPRNPSTTS